MAVLRVIALSGRKACVNVTRADDHQSATTGDVRAVDEATMVAMRFLRGLHGASTDTPKPGADSKIVPIYIDLRTLALSLDPSSVQIHPTADLPHVWGVVMDWSLDSNIVTLVCLADGTTSMYLSTGGGTIGAGQHDATAAASIRALKGAESLIDEFPIAETAPLPGPERTALALLTFSGLRRVEEETSGLVAGTSKFSDLANALQDVIHEIRLASDGGLASAGAPSHAHRHHVAFT
jgi:hypothetical protein